ncbi:hypothetical protein ABID25_005992 [Mesorhizobium abyssinicae]
MEGPLGIGRGLYPEPLASSEPGHANIHQFANLLIDFTGPAEAAIEAISLRYNADRTPPGGRQVVPLQ